MLIVQEMKQLMDNSANLSAAELEQKKDELLQKQKVNMLSLKAKQWATENPLDGSIIAYILSP